MVKKVLFGKESRDKMLLGVQQITNAVRVTMGSAGKCVLIGNAVYGNDGLVQLPTIISKDGWTVTKHFQLEDTIENRGAMIIKEAATKTVEQAGDATTATCVLAESLISEGMKMIDEGANSQELKKGMDHALAYVVEELKKMSIPARGDLKRIRQIATVSSNNDTSIGDLIADAYSKIGDDGSIDVEASNGIETEIKVTAGYKIDHGWESALFVNDPAKETCEFENPLILLYDKKITHHTQVEKVISMIGARPLLIICDGAIEEGLSYLAINNYQKRIKVCAIKGPEFGILRQQGMEDIALLTGATYISDIRGIDIIDDMQMNLFGWAKKVIVTSKETIIIEGNKDEAMFDEFIADLKMNLAQAKTEDEKYPIEKRIAKLTGSVAIIQIGAATETELNEKLDRVDDAVRATKAAIAEGFVAGGGIAFIRIPFWLNQGSKSYQQGMQLVFKALHTPLKQICENAGVDGEMILDQVLDTEGNMGYNAITGNIEDLVESGIIDSTKALRCALINAVSVAGMLLTSECSIITTH